MVMNFEFTTSSRIIFGCGSVANVPAILEGKGHKILLVTGKNQERAKPLTDKLPADKYKVFTFSVVREPTTEIISEGVQYAREKDCELIIGFGGGSVIDSAKAIAA
jgi:alcohol dehydrogenase class IV